MLIGGEVVIAVLDDIYAFNPYGELRLELSARVVLSLAAFVYAWRIVVAS